MPPRNTPKQFPTRPAKSGSGTPHLTGSSMPCRFIRGQGGVPILRCVLDSLQVLSRRLAGLPVRHDLEGDPLALLEILQTGALNCADMDEDILAAVLGLDESIALLRVEPLYGSLIHGRPLFITRRCEPYANAQPGSFEFWGR